MKRRITSYLTAGLLFASLLAAQTPVIFPGGVVDAASFQKAGNAAMPLGYPITIFGTNLASATVSNATLPLPYDLAGTSVTVDDTPAPLYFVSPGQINFQMPLLQNATSLVVTTASGTSQPFKLTPDSPKAFGIFTRDASGCGPGAVQNVKSDGSLEPNSPANSASPGDYIAVYASGLYVFPSVPIASPAPSSPLIQSLAVYSALVDSLSETVTPWAGLTPGLVGVAQVNLKIPESTREGCAVPLRLNIGYPLTQPVTISIRRGGGRCVDPSAASTGVITWEETIIGKSRTDTSYQDKITVSLQESPGRTVARPQSYYYRPNLYSAPSCPLPGYRSLDAGTVTVQSSDPLLQTGTFQLSAVPNPQSPINPLSPLPIDGPMIYQFAFPSPNVAGRNLTVRGSGGADIGAFQTALNLPFPISIQAPMAGQSFPARQPLTLKWGGGNAGETVSMSLVAHSAVGIDLYATVQAPATDGTLTMNIESIGYLPLYNLATELVVTHEPDPTKLPTFTAPGLTLGGQLKWKYTFRFPTISFQNI